MTEVATIIFLVSFTDFLPFISKHGIDLTDMHQHLLRSSLTIYTLSAFGFLANGYYSIMALFSNDMLFLPRIYIKVVIIYINIRL